ncbi:hypothetical protein EDD18DRAFT_1349024 [Armillaria luteobubalina]|uniref:Uncharacterized protein n=1 Tax=Armillaria luteobubalina TaxID=153913 RepID=A0AA39TTG1_9AGAR|nr:hypothetical protein EDD18DRAFT_1349024 [Armillaria luteobubalina]
MSTLSIPDMLASFHSRAPPPNPEITSLAHQIHLLDSQLFTLTDNSIYAYTACVCKVAMKPRAAGDMVEKMLECLQGLESDVDKHHNVIYSTGGLCKEWQDTQATGWAKGKHLVYLELSVATYNEKRVISSKKANEYATTTVVNEYFKWFFWVLPLNQDPESDSPAFVDDAELSEEQLTVKVAVIKQMSTAIPKWLEYHAGKTFAPHALSMKQLMCNLIALFLSHLSSVDGPWQIKDRAAAWASFVAEEFKKLSEETKKTWALQAAETVEVTKKSRGSAYAEPTLLPPEEAQKVIDSLAAYFGPLLEGMAKMIGCNISMVFVGPEPRKGGQVNVIILHEGVDKLPVPITFDEGGGEKYKFWLASLGEWGMSCFYPLWRSVIPVDQGIASGEDKSEVEAKTVKKKKSRAKGKKHMVDSSTAELKASKQKSKRSRGRDDQTEVCTLTAP